LTRSIVKKAAILFKIYIFFILPVSAQSIAERADAYLRSTSGKKNKFNGTVLIGIKGKIILCRGYGFKNKEAGVLNDSATIFQIGSVTKTFTSAIILYLYERGQLNLTDKIAKYLPDFPGGDRISIRNLLTHTSGIRDYLVSKEYDKEDFSRSITREKLLTFFSREGLMFEPGRRFSYSNSGYILLACIIEKITGKRYEKVVRREILEPEDMVHSGFDFVGKADSNKAINYTDIRKKHPESVAVFDSTHAPGCGNMYSTVGDLYKWDRALSAYTFLKKETLQMAYTPYKWKYGLGWFIDTLYGQRNIFHGGGTPGFHSNIERFPDNDVCIVLLSNNAYCDLNEISNRIASIIFDKPFEEDTY
jgi:CubicO group peptidase (beta-lactamase class C family)